MENESKIAGNDPFATLPLYLKMHVLSMASQETNQTIVTTDKKNLLPPVKLSTFLDERALSILTKSDIENIEDERQGFAIKDNFLGSIAPIDGLLKEVHIYKNSLTSRDVM